MGKIIWLASYPKSGNTWLRIVLTNYLRNSAEPANINDLERMPIASARQIFDDVLGVEASDLTNAEIAALRPAFYEQLARESKESLFMKVHDAFTYTPHGVPLLSKAATQGAIYLVRNPLDVAVSLAYHNHETVDQTILQMSRPKKINPHSPNYLPKQLPQHRLGWSEHVVSWLDAADLAVHLLRYEEMKCDPLTSFGAALRFAGFTVEEVRLQQAIQHASFANLQQQEARHGFQERPAEAKAFFRKGECGDWRNELTPAQAEQVIRDHGAVMRRLGYLGENGEIRD
jgi:hypothetical protein